MKILRKGPPWTLTTSCVKCQSLILIEENDVLLVPEGVRDSDFGKTVWKCPVCKTEHSVKVPDYVKDIATADADWNVGQGM